jgi:hypothetical protein
MHCMSTDVGYVRTTVSIREDMYQQLKRSGRGLSEALNEILVERFHVKETGFGRFPGLDTADLRDHEDRM